MAFSMHSHSGQFCPGHAKDSLEEVVLRAISLKMHLLALTEHMPRDQDKDLYPEEIQAGHTIASLLPRHHAYIAEAVRLRTKYASSITLLIGFEGEWIRPPSSSPSSITVPSLLSIPATDFFIGSVHHVHEIPIDFDRETYLLARAACSSSSSDSPSRTAAPIDADLFAAYFDAQFAMLTNLNPLVVGHFDLIRLFSDTPDGDANWWRQIGGGGVWARAERNLKWVVERGSLMEVNSSALRKGLREPYPCRGICEAFLAMGGKLTLSDDSHGVAQVGLNYGAVSEYLLSLGVTELYYLERQEPDSVTQGMTQSHLPLLVKRVPFTGLDGASFPCSVPR